jgi:polyhydroxyalkanoate synthesis regulator protein
MSSFAHNHDQMRKSLQDAFGGLFPFGSLEQMGKQNLALFEQTLKMFSPFPIAPGSEKSAHKSADKSKDAEPDHNASLDELRQRINHLQQQVDAYTKKDNGES